MDFLSCNPIVFVIGKEYEILINTVENGIVTIKIGGNVYYEENAGVLYSEKNYTKIRVPSEVLNEEKRYTVIYRRTIEKKAYYSEFEEPKTADFVFSPILKEENINIYHLADVHYRFGTAEKTARYFGDDLDLIIMNGDIGEVESIESYLNVCKFAGRLSEGRIPVIFSRGNHDTRGKLAERFTDFFPSNGNNTYYTFEIGRLWGVVLDCGEDKLDNHPEYGGTNIFEAFRRRETDFIKQIEPPKDKLCFAISHICPAQTSLDGNPFFDIDLDVYSAWNTELARIGIKFMINGHMHKAYLLPKNSEKSTLPHEYPVIVGSAIDYNASYLWGTALTVNKNTLDVKFTDNNQTVKEAYVIELETGNIIKV